MPRLQLLPTLEPPRVSKIAVVVILVVHAALLAWSATRHSPTLNEPGHLVAGISHWQFGRFELYRVNPPLSHMVAALPVLAAGAEYDWGKFHESPGARPVFAIGEDFVAANGERSIWLFTIARWACIPFSLLGGYLCFRWAREFYNTAAGFLALALWCFSPNILAHAELVTSDIAATSLGVTAGYFFWHWLKNPTWSRALVAGLALGLAELTKFTWIILFVLWPMQWLIWCLLHRQQKPTTQRWLRQGTQLIVILALGLYLINLGYGFEGSFTKLRDFTFISRTLSGQTAESTGNGNRFAESSLGDISVPLPKNYLLGIDVQKRDFEDFSRPSYLRGEFQDHGWWYYYLYAAAIKIPLGIWILFLLTCLRSIVSFRYCSRSQFADAIILLAPASVVFTLVSSQTGFSHHFRYVLPCFPFVLIWLSQTASIMTSFTWKSIVPIAAIFWAIGSSLWYFPHSLSYFNELVGGPMGGHAHLINSNIDWGQDLLHLKNWLDDHPDAKPFYLAYYGYLDPKSLGMDYEKPPCAESLGAKKVPQPGWYAVSVNYLRGYPWRTPQGTFTYFQQFCPVARAGYSIYIYRFTPRGPTTVDEGN